MNDYFDPRRLVRLLRGDLIRVYRIAGISAATVAAVLLLQALIFNPPDSSREIVYTGALMVLWFVAGPVVASLAFAELHDRERNEAYLLLPASAAEKVTARLLLVAVGYPLLTLLVVMASAWVIGLLNVAVGGTFGRVFGTFPLFDVHLIGLLVLHQSLFFAGAAWFRRNHFVKTALTVAVMSTAMLWFVVAAVAVIMPDVGAAVAASGLDNAGALLVRVTDSFAAVSGIVSALLYIVLPAFCWTLAWLRVGETQVSHGV